MTKEKQSAGQTVTQVTKQKNNEVNSKPVQNAEVLDNSAKIILDDPILCSQLLRNYTDIPLLKDVCPEDIEDVSERYVPLFLEERNADVVKKVHLNQNNGKQEDLYLISLIEHKANVDYNVRHEQEIKRLLAAI